LFIHSVELMFVLFVRYLQVMRSRRLGRAADLAAAAKLVAPLTTK
jgi:hypothetical protein